MCPCRTLGKATSSSEHGLGTPVSASRFCGFPAREGAVSTTATGDVAHSADESFTEILCCIFCERRSGDCTPHFLSPLGESRYAGFLHKRTIGGRRWSAPGSNGPADAGAGAMPRACRCWSDGRGRTGLMQARARGGGRPGSHGAIGWSGARRLGRRGAGRRWSRGESIGWRDAGPLRIQWARETGEHGDCPRFKDRLGPSGNNGADAGGAERVIRQFYTEPMGHPL